MSKKNKSTQELTEDYMKQAMPASSHVVYTPADGKDKEGDPHFGGPMCYSCCGLHCWVEVGVLVAVILVCCAYGTNGTCCDFCYWPF